jgi:type I restriction enzyme, S subunit
MIWTISQAQVKNYSVIKNGDIIMADASEDYLGVGKSVEVKNIDKRKVISGLHTFVLRDNKGILADGFKGYLHASSYIKNKFDRLATGMKVYGVSKNNLKDVLIPVPSKDEQKQITSILTSMDNDISVVETKLQKLKQIKHGMMQNLLTGRIRLIKS